MAVQTPAPRIEELHREHGDRIRRYLARLVGTTDAEDLQQEVFERRSVRSVRSGATRAR